MIEVIDQNTNKRLQAKVKITNLDNKDVYEFNEDQMRDGIFALKLKEGNLYNVEINKVGYILLNKDITVPSTEKYTDTTKFTFPMTQMKTGEKLILRNIYFASDEAVCLEQSLIELEKVVNFMNTNPTATIEISAHTDDDGDHDFRPPLSDQGNGAVEIEQNV